MSYAENPLYHYEESINVCKSIIDDIGIDPNVLDIDGRNCLWSIIEGDEKGGWGRKYRLQVLKYLVEIQKVDCSMKDKDGHGLLFNIKHSTEITAYLKEKDATE